MAGKHFHFRQLPHWMSEISHLLLTGCCWEQSSITQGPLAGGGSYLSPAPPPTQPLSSANTPPRLLTQPTDSSQHYCRLPTLCYTVCWQDDKRETAQLHFCAVSRIRVMQKVVAVKPPRLRGQIGLFVALP